MPSSVAQAAVHGLIPKVLFDKTIDRREQKESWSPAPLHSPESITLSSIAP